MLFIYLLFELTSMMLEILNILFYYLKNILNNSAFHVGIQLLFLNIYDNDVSTRFLVYSIWFYFDANLNSNIK